MIVTPKLERFHPNEVETVPSDGTTLVVRCRFVKPRSMMTRNVSLYIDDETADAMLVALRDFGIRRRRRSTPPTTD